MKISKKQFFFIGISLLLILVVVICAFYAPSRGSNLKLSENHRIIIDTDTAGDDAMAIALAAKAPNVVIEGVTVLPGNVDTEQGTKNALMTLEKAGVSNIPVYKGSDSTVAGIKRECFSVFGTDGMGDMDLIHPLGQAKEQNAVDFIIETIKNNPGEIELLALGPATNIAMAIQKDPEAMKQVKMIWSMGTAGFGNGNATPVAEFNVYNDPDAYKIMLESGLPITIIGLDLFENDDVLHFQEDMKKLKSSSELGEFLVNSWSKLYEFKKEKQNLDYVDICDAVAAGVLIWDNLAETSQKCASYVCTKDDPSLGQVIFYKENYTYDSMPEVENYNITVITSVNAEKYKDSCVEMLK